MDDKILQQFEIVFGELISAYQKMCELYDTKREALVHKTLDNLKITDEQIMENYNLITDLNNERLRIVQQQGYEELTLSDIIKICEELDSPLKSRFEEFKVTINEVREKLALLEQINVELIKHGLIMSNNMLNIILSACSVQTGTYNNQGKNTYSDSLGISSVCEDA